MNRSGSAIAIMAKQPEPGKVKTRLCPPLTPREAADLYGAFLLDTVGLASGIPEADLFLACDPHTARGFFSRLFPRPVACIPQGTGDLGNTALTGLTKAVLPGVPETRHRRKRYPPSTAGMYPTGIFPAG